MVVQLGKSASVMDFICIIDVVLYIFLFFYKFVSISPDQT